MPKPTSRRGRSSTVYSQECRLKVTSENMDNRTHLLSGFQLYEKGAIQDAMQIAQEILTGEPENVHANLLAGYCSIASGHLEEAIEFFQKSLKINPAFKASMIPLAKALRRTGQIMEAVAVYKDLWGLDRSNTGALITMGVLLLSISASEEAKQIVELALKINPELSTAHVLLGRIAAKGKANVEEAVGHCLRAIKINPQATGAYHEMGSHLLRAGDPMAACRAFKKIMDVSKQKNSLIYSNWLFVQNYLDDISPQELFAHHKGWQKSLKIDLPKLDSVDFGNVPDPAKKIKVGFTSADFYGHSVFNFLNGLFEGYDRSRYEFICFSNRNLALEDRASTILKTYVDAWHVIEGLASPEIHEIIRKLEIDILIDLSGHSADTCLPLYFPRSAPVQVTWLGYPNTTGLDSMDYRIVDSITDPEEWADELASEKLYRLPHPFLCFRPHKELYGEVPPEPHRHPDKIVFGTFNEAPKYSPSVLRLWCEILKQIPNAELLMKCGPLGEKKTKEFLMENLNKYGIEASRVRLLGFIPTKKDHMSTYNKMDVALDPFPYNGTTTSCEALWMGVPFITKAGDRHCARVGMSLLKSIGLDDWVTYSDEEYVAKAVEVANNRDQLMNVKSTLRSKMQNSPLCDHASFARKFEHALSKMWQNWCSQKTA